ncbi:hypothetical protein [uncultured Clostridium sp.]|uniref:hypothetical protein n=1 Tax=uncultured Clostridium sp. TaxID=59620 RepID=UPI0025F17AA7|nr:hypothetical protein [uncultured Clostridium sp.]
MFLRKGIDNPDCYVPVGTSMQGIYRISENKTNRQSYSLNDSTTTILEPYDSSFTNKNIMNDLSINYKNFKSKFK